MVSIAFMLLTASTLAVHGKYLSKDPDTQNGCNGKTFCDIKPADYPQQEIDRLLIKELPKLHRRKREGAIDTPKLEPGSTGGNCKTVMEMKTPYELRNKDHVPQIVVQSKFFEQKIPHVTCEITDEPCFQNLLRQDSNTETMCKQKFINTLLFVYDPQNNKVNAIDSPIPIDCVCETS
ncbi:uncharacterized protein LOC125242716 [Leguminivora glycinivorella]|uniref:uncharacterized protein LOC125242716 n=1 Tax=Leguminivora glycinivorella TaxID=1035111 RepID=UPI00200E4BDD|nr:uncharacterized protein LOC125242716 [Leguminivora glycinivorella]